MQKYMEKASKSSRAGSSVEAAGSVKKKNSEAGDSLEVGRLGSESVK